MSKNESENRYETVDESERLLDELKRRHGELFDSYISDLYDAKVHHEAGHERIAEIFREKAKEKMFEDKKIIGQLNIMFEDEEKARKKLEEYRANQQKTE